LKWLTASHRRRLHFPVDFSTAATATADTTTSFDTTAVSTAAAATIPVLSPSFSSIRSLVRAIDSPDLQHSLGLSPLHASSAIAEMSRIVFFSSEKEEDEAGKGNKEDGKQEEYEQDQEEDGEGWFVELASAVRGQRRCLRFWAKWTHRRRLLLLGGGGVGSNFDSSSNSSNNNTARAAARRCLLRPCFHALMAFSKAAQHLTSNHGHDHNTAAAASSLTHHPASSPPPTPLGGCSEQSRTVGEAHEEGEGGIRRHRGLWRKRGRVVMHGKVMVMVQRRQQRLWGQAKPPLSTSLAKKEEEKRGEEEEEEEEEEQRKQAMFWDRCCCQYEATTSSEVTSEVEFPHCAGPPLPPLPSLSPLALLDGQHQQESTQATVVRGGQLCGCCAVGGDLLVRLLAKTALEKQGRAHLRKAMVGL
jgi:hypothetical protein